MLLLHPETALLQEFISIVCSPRHILFLDLVPCCSPLHRSHIRILVNSVLEFINTYQIRDSHQSICQMIFSIVVCLLAEEALHPRICPELHRHRMHLVDLTCRMEQFRNLLEFCCCEAGKCMTSLMSKNIYVCVSSVEVGENERCMVLRKECAVTAYTFTRLCHEIKQIVLNHEVKELACFRRQFTVHLLCFSHHVITVADRHCISLRAGDRFIIIVEFINAQCFSSSVI